MSKMTDHWLLAKEMCSYMGVNRDLRYRRVATQVLPVHMMGRLFNFNIYEIDACA